jgi:hypothetical protein
MKKLLSTTAIIGAVAFATSASAADLQVNVGGFLDFQAGYTSDDIIGDSAAGAGQDDANEINFNNDTEVHFTVDGKADNGLEYGAVIELEADIDNSDAQDGGTNADKTYLFLQGGWGRVELGGNTDASEALSVNTSTFASATGGVDGDFYRYTDIGNTGTAGATLTGFTGIIRPDLPIANAGDNGINATGLDEDSTKVTYYTPRFAGFQAGVSYSPNSNATGVTLPSSAGFENVLSGGVNYAAQWDAIGFKAAITGQTADAKAAGGNDIEAWDAGANLTFAGFTVGGSYGDWDDALGVGTDSEYWDAGVGYEFGAFSASATYLSSNAEPAGAGADDEFDNLSVGIDYKLAPGLVPYAEVSFFDFDGAGTGIANDNEGTVVILGTELSF